MNYSAIVLAAGKGSRSGLSYNKVLYSYQNEPILMRSLRLFQSDPDCRQIVVVCAQSEKEEFETRFKSTGCEFAIGGKERQDSVLAGLKKVREPYAMIHDGARPFCTRALLERIKTALRYAQGVIPGVAVTDTIKQVDENGMVIATPVRSTLRAVQTPQAFATEQIQTALEIVREKHWQVTDDAQAMELALQIPSYGVEGDPENFKVTSRQDLERLEEREKFRMDEAG